MRYYPFQRVKDIDDNWISVDQFEFNFIQTVFYPQRMAIILKAKKAAKERGAVF